MIEPKNRNELLQRLRNQTPKSGEMWRDAQDVVPGGLASFARRFEPYPFYTQRGKGPYIWDIDGNQYIDCCTSYGVLLLGHCPQVTRIAIAEQIDRGTIYGAPHEMEITFAKRLIESIPCAEQLILCNSGTEATMQAIRIMRAFTGKKKIAKFEGCYHGWHDYVQWSVALDPLKMGPPDRPNLIPGSAGIPDEIKDTIILLPFEDSAFEMIEKNADDLAGVMIEPIIGTYNLPLEDGFLQRLRDVTRQNDVLLMYDEIVTGFRLALGGAQEYFGVLPDLASYGKIIGGGFPIGAVGCSKDMMDSVLRRNDMSISVAGTFSGNPMTLAAGGALLDYLFENQEIYEQMNTRGDRLRSGFNKWTQSMGYPAIMTGIASLFQVHMKPGPIVKPRDTLEQNADALRDLQLFLRLNGVFIPWLHLAFISAVHTDQIVDDVLNVFKKSVESSLRINGAI